MTSLPITEGQLIALFMQSITYGIHIVTFAICVWTLLNKSDGQPKPVHWPWLSVAIALFAVGTIDVSFNLYHNLVAFIFYTGPGGAERAFDKVSNWVNVIRSVWFFIGGLVSDAALMYRCWAIWSRTWSVVALPILLWIASIAVVVVYLHSIATLEELISIPDAGRLRASLLAYLSITLALNFLTTGLIVYRIWKVTRRSSEFFTQTWRGSGRTDFSAINVIFVESAFLYTTAIIITFFTAITTNNLTYGFSDITVELSGISFDLIIIRISRGVATEQTRAFAQTFPAPIKLDDIMDSTTVQDPTTTHLDLTVTNEQLNVSTIVRAPSDIEDIEMNKMQNTIPKTAEKEV